MTDRHVRFARMWTAGHKIAEIAGALHVSPGRARHMRIDLGLPARYPKFANKPRSDSPARAAAIPCLCCRRKFDSEDRRGNRVCNPCKNGRSWRGGQDASVAVPGR